MVVCAVVGVLLLALGAWTLPRPGAAERASAPATALAAPTTAAVDAPAGSASASTAPPSSEPSRAAGSAAALLVPEAGPGTYETASTSVPTTARSGRLYRFDVRVEKGLDLDPDDVAKALEKTLDDPRSWRYTGGVRFSQVAAGETADLHAYLVTPRTTDKLCYPLLTRGEVSCHAGNRVVLNAKRWVFGAEAYGAEADELAAYRQYLVNHEFGHALGHQHVGCPAGGRPSPVMLQQTKGLQGCKANPWPSVTKG